jgi:hypothetical protein
MVIVHKQVSSTSFAGYNTLQAHHPQGVVNYLNGIR